jgi:hypothetical protein
MVIHLKLNGDFHSHVKKCTLKMHVALYSLVKGFELIGNDNE